MSKRTSARRIAGLCAVAVVFALTSGCGNRNSDEELHTAVTIADGGTGPAGASPVVGNQGLGSPAQSAQSAQSAPSAAADGAAAVPGLATAPDRSATVSSGPESEAKRAATSERRDEAHGGEAKAACTNSLPPMKIGSIGAYSGVLGAQLSPGPKALAAWVSWSNAKGGIACHPVELLVADDGSDPAVNQSLVRDFVESKGVSAFVFMSSPLAGAASVQYLTVHQIPVFGTEGGSDWVNENPTFFPQMTSGQPLQESAVAMAGVLKPGGKIRIGIASCIELPGCTRFSAAFDKVALRYGLTPVYKSGVSITQPNYTSTCIGAKNAGADIMFFVFDGNTSLRMKRSCDAVGYNPIILVPGVGVTPDQASSPSLSGVLMSNVVMPWYTPGNAALADYRAAIAKYAPGLPGSPVGVEAWAAGQLFGTVAAKAGPTLTSASLLGAAFTIKNNDLGGLTAPLTFTKGDQAHPQTMCWWAMRFTGADVATLGTGRQGAKPML